MQAQRTGKQFRAVIGTLNNPHNHYGDDFEPEEFLCHWHDKVTGAGATYVTG